MKNKIKHLVLTLVLVIAVLGATGFSQTPRRFGHGRPGRVYIIRPYYYNPFWYDPFWYSWYAGPPVYTVPQYTHGTIKTEIEPKNAEVYVNGGYVGTANKFRGIFHGLDLRPGNYELEFRAPNYRPLKMKVYVAANKTLKLKEQLQLDVRS